MYILIRSEVQAINKDTTLSMRQQYPLGPRIVPSQQATEK